MLTQGRLLPQSRTLNPLETAFPPLCFSIRQVAANSDGVASLTSATFKRVDEHASAIQRLATVRKQRGRWGLRRVIPLTEPPAPAGRPTGHRQRRGAAHLGGGQAVDRRLRGVRAGRVAGEEARPGGPDLANGSSSSTKARQKGLQAHALRLPQHHEISLPPLASIPARTGARPRRRSSGGSSARRRASCRTRRRALRRPPTAGSARRHCWRAALEAACFLGC
jgi:hypothetical protein